MYCVNRETAPCLRTLFGQFVPVYARRISADRAAHAGSHRIRPVTKSCTAVSWICPAGGRQSGSVTASRLRTTWPSIAEVPTASVCSANAGDGPDLSRNRRLPRCRCDAPLPALFGDGSSAASAIPFRFWGRGAVVSRDGGLPTGCIRGRSQKKRSCAVPKIKFTPVANRRHRGESCCLMYRSVFRCGGGAVYSLYSCQLLIGISSSLIWQKAWMNALARRAFVMSGMLWSMAPRRMR